jgi:hypothetical protein
MVAPDRPFKSQASVNGHAVLIDATLCHRHCHCLQDEVSVEARATLSGVTAADLPGLLRAACRRSPTYACLLIDHDRDHLHLLHPASSPPASSVATRSTRSRARQTSVVQGQQYEDTGTNQLLMDLFEHIVKQQNNHVLERLCQVPGAQQLSEYSW